MSRLRLPSASVTPQAKLCKDLTQGLYVAKRALWPQFHVHQIRWALAGQRGQQVFGSQHGH